MKRGGTPTGRDRTGRSKHRNTTKAKLEKPKPLLKKKQTKIYILDTFDMFEKFWTETFTNFEKRPYSLENLDFNGTGRDEIESRPVLHHCFRYNCKEPTKQPTSAPAPKYVFTLCNVYYFNAAYAFIRHVPPKTV